MMEKIGQPTITISPLALIESLNLFIDPQYSCTINPSDLKTFPPIPFFLTLILSLISILDLL